MIFQFDKRSGSRSNHLVRGTAYSQHRTMRNDDASPSIEAAELPDCHSHLKQPRNGDVSATI